jgi:murein DD-endopeptidase MepM/ murein hydrolase activator NlpD
LEDSDVHTDRAYRALPVGLGRAVKKWRVPHPRRRRWPWIEAAVLLLALSGATPAGAALRIDLQARAIQPGELIVVTIEAPETDPIHVTAFDQPIIPTAVAPGRWRALVGIDLDVRPGSYDLVVDSGPRHETRRLEVRPRRFRTRRLTVDPDFVTPPPSVEARIAQENELLRATWAASPAEALWTKPFVRPVHAAANSAFGTRSIFNGVPRNAHAGADFLSPAGTPVRAPNSGKVVIARNLYFSGNTVIVDHGAGLFSLLAHLSTIDVREGEAVEVGTIVGRVGATGRVTGPHLHWTVRVSGGRVDPLSLLALLGRRDKPVS